MRPFAMPAGFKPERGSLVKLKPGVADSPQLRANELARILTFIDMDGETHLQRQRDMRWQGREDLPFRPMSFVLH